MKSTELKAFLRKDTGKANSKHMRREGNVPGVIYDKQEATHIFFNYKELKPVLYTPDTYIVKLDVEGKQVSTIVRDADYHPVTERIQHVELLDVSDDRPVVLSLPVSLVGRPIGVGEGGKLVTKLRKIDVKGIPSKLPEKIEIDVSDLALGQTIKIADANIDIEGLQVITPPFAGVASVEIPRALRSAGIDGEGEGEVEEGEGAEEGEATEE